MVMELEQIVQKPTWKEVLLDLIITEQLDPWNVDIIKVADAFIKKIKELRTMELFVPANMVLASAILLRYKSQVLNFQEQAATTDFNAAEGEENEKPKIEELKLLSRIPPKRQITLAELLKEIDQVLKYEDKRGKIEKDKVEAIMNLKITGMNIEKQMEDVYNMILKQMNGEGYVLFSDLIANKVEKKEVVYTLLSVLHLTQKNMIDLRQEKLFGEIFISTVEEKPSNKNEE